MEKTYRIFLQVLLLLLFMEQPSISWTQTDKTDCLRHIQHYEYEMMEFAIVSRDLAIKQNLPMYRNSYLVLLEAIADNITLSKKNLLKMYDWVGGGDEFYLFDQNRDSVLVFQKQLRYELKKKLDEIEKLTEAELQESLKEANHELETAIAILKSNGCFSSFEEAGADNISIEGNWKAGEMFYEINETELTFTWKRKDAEESAEGMFIGPNLVQVRWENSVGKGSAKGKVIVDGGRAIRIEWDNGINFVRTILPPPRNLPIGGSWWLGNIEYVFTQNGKEFSWDRKDDYNEKAKGKFTDIVNQVEATWTNNGGKGSAKGTVIGENGVAIRIEWNNGIVFTRK